MIVTLKITHTNGKLIFLDLFHMDSESEVFTKFQFLKDKPLQKPTPRGFYLEIKSLKNTLIQVFTNSIFKINEFKEQIYDVVIEKQNEYLLQNGD